MPYVHLSTNVSKSAADAAAVHSALSKALSEGMDRPEQFVMTKIDFDVSLQLGKSDAPCAYVQVRGIHHADEAYNTKTTKGLTDVVESLVGVPADRVFVVVEDVNNTNWAAGGKLVTWITD